MKKVLALVLAAVMSLGMASVAFASEDEVASIEGYYNPQANLYAKDDKYLQVDLGTAYKMDDKKVDLRINTSSGVPTVGVTGNVEPGTTLYFQVAGGKFLKDQVAPDRFTDSGMVKAFSNVSDLKDYRISYSIDDGKNMIASAKFVKADYKASSSIVSGGTVTGKMLFIALETKDNFIMESQSVNLTLKVSSKNGAYLDEINANVAPDKNITVQSNFNREFLYEEGNVSNGYYTIGDKAMVLKFDDDADDVTLCFEKDVEVWGNMKGQKDVFVRMATENDAIEDKYPDATIRFFEGDKDTFRRDVKVTIPYEATTEKPFLYLVDAKGNLTKLYGGSNAEKTANETNVKFDDVAGAFTFSAKTLGHYVLSDTELKNTTTGDVTTDVPAPGEEPTPETNPGTGANDFVGLAVALAVVSLAGITVAKRK